jgi:hypothetical protein
MVTWEYELFSTADVPSAGFMKHQTREGVLAHLNELGAEGWEVVNAHFAAAGGVDFIFQALLKRQKKP